MSWKKEITIIVRTLINDVVSPYTYSDSRICQTIVIAAQYVQFDVNLHNKYSVNIVVPEITPDPVSTSDDRGSLKDEIFISLVGLKTACIIDQSLFRTKAAMEGIKASLGSASLSVGGSLAGWKTILDKGPCSLYESLTDHWDVANANAVRAIFSPFIGNNFDPQALNRVRNDYSRDTPNEYF
jgi:hypothetical protein